MACWKDSIRPFSHTGQLVAARLIRKKDDSKNDRRDRSRGNNSIDDD